MANALMGGGFAGGARTVPEPLQFMHLVSGIRCQDVRHLVRRLGARCVALALRRGL